MEIILEILGDPKSQMRPRFFQKGNFKGTYDPSATDKDNLLSIVQSKAPEEPISGPIEMEMTFYLPRPKNHYKTGKNSNMLRDDAPEWHTGKKDWDNLAKLVCDSMNKVFWRDDCQICFVTVKKLYAERPRTHIIIKTLRQ